MDNIERTRLAIDTVDGMLCVLFKGNDLDLSDINMVLPNILEEHKDNESVKKFITTVINRDTNNIFYKYLLEVLSPLGIDKPKDRICYRLMLDIKTYIEEGLSGRLQLQLDTHDDIMAEESISNAPHLRYPIMLTRLYRHTTPDKVDKVPTKYKSPESMRVINNIPADTATICSEFYCNGDRDPRIASVVYEISTTLAIHNDLYIKNILTKLDETDCVPTSIIHGIGTVLPEHVSVCDLNSDSWDFIVMSIIRSIRNHNGNYEYTCSLAILNKIMVEFRGTSSFNNRDLVGMVLGYSDSESVDIILEAKLLMCGDPLDYYF